MSGITIGSDKNGTLLPVRVQPRGRTDAVEGVRNEVLLVSVSAAPADGAANAAVIEVVAQALGCPGVLWLLLAATNRAIKRFAL